MTTRLVDDLVAGSFSRNRGQCYSIAMTHATQDLSLIHIPITFLSGRSYCCAEPGYHVSIAGFRKVASERNIELPHGLHICFNGVVEEGVDLKSSGAITRPYEYDEVFTDGSKPIAPDVIRWLFPKSLMANTSATCRRRGARYTVFSSSGGPFAAANVHVPFV